VFTRTGWQHNTKRALPEFEDKPEVEIREKDEDEEDEGDGFG
jgi:hypothetical protein